MPTTFHLEIITPYKLFFEGEVEMIIIKTTNGEVGILADHIPMVTPIDIGNIRIKQDGIWKEAVLTEGFIEIKDNISIILTDTAEWPEEIDVNRAEEAKLRAEERLGNIKDHVEFTRCSAALTRALVRLEVAKINNNKSKRRED